MRWVVVLLVACGAAPRPVSLTPMATPPARPTLDLVPQVLSAGIWTRIVVSNDGKLAVVGEGSGLLRVIDLAQAKILQTFGVHQGGIRALTIAPDGRRAASADTNGTVCTLDLESVRLRNCWQLGQKLYPTAVGDYRVAISTDRLVTATPLRKKCAISYYCPWRFDVFDIVIGAYQSSSTGDTTPWYLAFAPGGRSYGWVAIDGVHVRDAATNEHAGHFRNGIDDDEAAFSFAADGAIVTEAHGALESMADPGDRVSRIKVSLDKSSTDVRWWDLYFTKPTAVANLPGRKGVYVGLHAAYLLDFVRGTQDKLPHLEAEVVGASPDGSRVVIGDAVNGIIAVLVMATGARSDVKLPKAELHTAVITPDNVALVGTQWGILRIDLATGVINSIHTGAPVVRLSASGETALTRGRLTIREEPRPVSTFIGQRHFHTREITGSRAAVRSEIKSPEFTFVINKEPPPPVLDCDLPGGCTDRELPRGLDVKRGHRGQIITTSVSRDGKHVLTVGVDGTARLWYVVTGASIAITTTSEREWLIYGDDAVFDSSRYGARLLAAVDNARTLAIDQLAITNNRPDLLFERVGIANPDTIAYFRGRHLARLAPVPAGDSLANALASAPIARLDGAALDGDMLDVTVTLDSKAVALASYQIWINQVPVFPGRGPAVSGAQATVRHRIPASPGTNTIDVAALSTQGIESSRAVHTIAHAAAAPGDLYFVGIGISRYRDRELDLGFAAKDADDLAKVFRRFEGHGFRKVHAHVLRDGEATAKAIHDARRLVAGATVNDTIVVFVAGHGTHSRDTAADYLFVTHDYDASRERETTAPFATIEGLLSASAARRRLLLVDTCESGDRDGEIADASPPPGGARSRTSRALVRVTGASGSPTRRVPRPFVVDRDRLILTSLGLGTGTVVLAASRWNEASYESPKWDNGIFTAELKRALTSPVADVNGDGAVSIDELARYVTAAVAAQTDQLQHPIISQDNPTAGLALPIAGP